MDNYLLSEADYKIFNDVSEGYIGSDLKVLRRALNKLPALLPKIDTKLAKWEKAVKKK